MGAPTADEWSAFWSCLTFLVAVVAAVIALVEYERARRRDLEDGAPSLSVDLDLARGGLWVVVVNTGRTAARDCRIEVNRVDKGQPDASRLLLRRELSRLAPGASIRYNLAAVVGPSSSWAGASLMVEHAYDQEPAAVSRFDLDGFEEAFVERDPLTQIAAALDRLSRRR